MDELTPPPDVSPVSLTNGYFAGDVSQPKASISPNVRHALPNAKRAVKLAPASPPEGSVVMGPGNVNGRGRTMSQSSSTDREMSTEVMGQPLNGNNDETRSTSRKRPSSDTLDYPRRRATIAVRMRMLLTSCRRLTYA